VRAIAWPVHTPLKEILYDWGGANVWLFHAVNDIRSGFLDAFMQLGTGLGDHGLFPVYMALLALSAAFAVARTPLSDPVQFRECALLWSSVVAVFGVAYVLDGLLIDLAKPLLDLPRPPLALPPETIHIIGQPEYHHSLPSGHASFAMLVVASLWPVLGRRLRVAGVLFVLWVGISRVSLGAHFPADVAAGYLSSLIVVLLVRASARAVIRTAAGTQ
jgi:membrane-associated phospholipid phosphatase